jgi:hypothetical protein
MQAEGGAKVSHQERKGRKREEDGNGERQDGKSSSPDQTKADGKRAPGEEAGAAKTVCKRDKKQRHKRKARPRFRILETGTFGHYGYPHGAIAILWAQVFF